MEGAGAIAAIKTLTGGRFQFDIWYNTKIRWGNVSNRFTTMLIKVHDIETITLHELGHILGLPHINELGSIMFPGIDLGTHRLLSRGDIQRIHELCGCVGEACDIEKSYQKIHALRQSKGAVPTMPSRQHDELPEPKVVPSPT
ncbi:MAG: matrixin family metalloprotease [Proteobacteria bacterium]|nr:matrixin family metalloprotease [Pseudomonadota bacterium]